jgi:hypothetical protein
MKKRHRDDLQSSAVSVMGRQQQLKKQRKVIKLVSWTQEIFLEEVSLWPSPEGISALGGGRQVER